MKKNENEKIVMMLLFLLVSSVIQARSRKNESWGYLIRRDDLKREVETNERYRRLGTVSIADDTPMASEELGFDFPYMGSIRRVGFINANGVIGFEPAPACGSFFATLSSVAHARCDINTSWYDVIAGYLTDLNPAQSGDIFARGDKRSYLGVRWENTSLFGAESDASKLTMEIILYRDGRVDIRHEHVFDDSTIDEASFHVRSAIVVGLRAPTKYHFTTDAQVARSKKWNTKVFGIYPGARPSSGTRWLACPVPTIFFTCRQDENFLRITSTQPFGCAAEAELFGHFFCAYLDQNNHRNITMAQLLFDDQGFFDAMLCAIPQQISTFEIWYKAAPLETKETFDNGQGDGGLATEDPEYRRLVASFYPECSHLSIDFGSPVTDCAGELSTSPSFIDSQNECCDWNDTDCLGVCNGPASVRLVNNVALCCNFDCNGACNGRAVVDNCGVCDGGNQDLDDCGVCFGSGGCTDEETQPPDVIISTPIPTPKASGIIHDGRDENDENTKPGRWKSLGRSVTRHPWVVVIVALEILVSVACFRSCTSRPRRTRRDRDMDHAWTDIESDRLRRTALSSRDLDALVANTSRPPTQRRSEFRYRVAEAYQSAVIALCATPINSTASRVETNNSAADSNQDENDAICSICLDDLQARRVLTLPNCGHTFHAACLSPWITAHNSCPFCKRSILERIDTSDLVCNDSSIRSSGMTRRLLVGRNAFSRIPRRLRSVSSNSTSTSIEMTAPSSPNNLAILSSPPTPLSSSDSAADHSSLLFVDDDDDDNEDTTEGEEEDTDAANITTTTNTSTTTTSSTSTTSGSYDNTP
uniref:RING-type domain-containing protein n=1 Tax=Aureoumbra lagunensis TaxID=44058 RepID=A0A7S3K3I0_9STRA